MCRSNTNKNRHSIWKPAHIIFSLIVSHIVWRGLGRGSPRRTPPAHCSLLTATPFQPPWLVVPIRPAGVAGHPARTAGSSAAQSSAGPSRPATAEDRGWEPRIFGRSATGCRPAGRHTSDGLRSQPALDAHDWPPEATRRPGRTPRPRPARTQHKAGFSANQTLRRSSNGWTFFSPPLSCILSQLPKLY